ncbi:uncharacterized protein LOC141628389 [Silene latifolia]|uniref:uncharacterized protein LOC141628389 n=1 Tax=Silene latifolia TaxID=37657 RepID=UPI003D76BE40
MAKMKNAYTSDLWLASYDDYTIRGGYNWLRQSTPRISWWKISWNVMNVPRTSFIYRADNLGRLLTRDRLARMDGAPDMNCYLCQNATKSHSHLFFYCPLSSQCVSLLQAKLLVNFNPNAIAQWNSRGRRNNILRRRIVCACHVHLTYLIWQVRNKTRLLQQVIHPKVIASQAVQGILSRFWARNFSAIPNSDEAWIRSCSLS